MARIGPKRHRATLQSPTGTADGLGGYSSTTWADYGKVWVESDPAAARELLYAGGFRGRTMHFLKMRHRADVEHGHRVLFRGRTLEIVSIENIGERDRELLLVCEEAVP